jgi:hypothetical protein
VEATDLKAINQTSPRVAMAKAKPQTSGASRPKPHCQRNFTLSIYRLRGPRQTNNC